MRRKLISDLLSCTYLESYWRDAVFTESGHHVDDEERGPAQQEDAHYNPDGDGGLQNEIENSLLLINQEPVLHEKLLKIHWKTGLSLSFFDNHGDFLTSSCIFLVEVCLQIHIFCPNFECTPPISSYHMQIR